MKKSLVSVIIPVYNTEKYIRECVQSVITQSYSNIEILLIDDGSTDNSPSICNSFLDKRIRVFHMENHGLSFCRQFGIDNCNGEFFVTIDADDYILPNYIEMMLNTIQDSFADICICERFDFWEEKKQRIGLNNKSEALNLDSMIMCSSYFDIARLTESGDSWNKMYRLSFVKESGVRFSLPSRFNGNDLLFNYKLVLHSPRYVFINMPLLMHRMTKGSMVRTGNKPIQEGFEFIISSIMEEVLRCGFGNALEKELSKVYSLFLYLSFLYNCRYSTSLIRRTRQLEKSNNLFLQGKPSLAVVPYDTSIRLEKKFNYLIAKHKSLELVFLAIICRLKEIIKKLIK